MKPANHLKINIILTVFIFTSFVANAQKCSIHITSPLNGSSCGTEIEVNGTAEVPSNGHLWLFVAKSGLNSWFPQGGGEALIIDGHWKVRVYCGVKDIQDFGEFNIIAMIVGNQTHQGLVEWFDVANKNSKYVPIPLPSALGGCDIKRCIVNKTTD